MADHVLSGIDSFKKKRLKRAAITGEMLKKTRAFATTVILTPRTKKKPLNPHRNPENKRGRPPDFTTAAEFFFIGFNKNNS